MEVFRHCYKGRKQKVHTDHQIDQGDEVIEKQNNTETFQVSEQSERNQQDEKSREPAKHDTQHFDRRKYRYWKPNALHNPFIG